MKSKNPLTTPLLIVVSTLCGLAIVFAIASIFVPDFRDNGSAVAMVILGALTTALSALVATRFFGGGSQPAEDEVRKRDATDGS